MKAVKCKHNHISFINSLESKLYNLAEAGGSINATELSERDVHIAEEMHQKNIFNKQVKNGHTVYTIYSAKQKV